MPFSFACETFIGNCGSAQLVVGQNYSQANDGAYTPAPTWPCCQHPCWNRHSKLNLHKSSYCIACMQQQLLPCANTGLSHTHIGTQLLISWWWVLHFNGCLQTVMQSTTIYVLLYMVCHAAAALAAGIFMYWYVRCEPSSCKENAYHTASCQHSCALEIIWRLLLWWLELEDHNFGGQCGHAWQTERSLPCARNAAVSMSTTPNPTSHQSKMVRSKLQLTCEVPSASPTAITEKTCEGRHRGLLPVPLICAQHRYSWHNSVSQLYIDMSYLAWKRCMHACMHSYVARHLYLHLMLNQWDWYICSGIAWFAAQAVQQSAYDKVWLGSMPCIMHAPGCMAE